MKLDLWKIKNRSQKKKIEIKKRNANQTRKETFREVIEDKFRRISYCLVANNFSVDIVVSEFELLSCYYVHRRINTRQKVMNTLMLSR